MIEVLRWILVVPAAVAGWWLAFAIGLWLHFYLEKALCPPEDIVSGFCHNHNVVLFLKVLKHAAVGVSAIVVCVVSPIVAPSHKTIVAVIALLAGSAFAVSFFWQVKEWSLLGVAIGSGIAATSLVGWHQRRKNA